MQIRNEGVKVEAPGQGMRLMAPCVLSALSHRVPRATRAVVLWDVRWVGGVWNTAG